MKSLALTASALVLIAVGCSSSSGSTRSDSPAQSRSTASTVSPEAAIEQAVRRAITKDHQLSVRVLWTNVVPAHPEATAGPALVNLRRSVTARAKRGIRVRLLSEHFEITSIKLDPSYAQATAIVSDPQRVQPSNRNGTARGRPVELHERVRLELRRVPGTSRFVAWKVVALK